MIKEYTLWARRPEDPEWMEQVITTNKTDMQIIEKAKKWAIEQGFIDLRITTLNIPTNEKEEKIVMQELSRAWGGR